MAAARGVLLLALAVLCCGAAALRRGPWEQNAMPLDEPDRDLQQTAAYRRQQRNESPDPVPRMSIAEVYGKKHNIPAERVFPSKLATVNTLGFTYRSNSSDGIETRRGDRVIFEVPPRLRSADYVISRVWLGHRKNKDNSSLFSKKSYIEEDKDKGRLAWDLQPAYHAVKCHDPVTGEWREWFGPRYTTEEGDPRRFDDPLVDNRFYAPRRDSNDVFYEHIDDLAHRLNGRGSGRCDLIMIKNVAPLRFVCNKADASKNPKQCWNPLPLAEGRVHGVRVEFLPRQKRLNKKMEEEAIFTPSTVFANPPHDLVPHFGGGREVAPRDFRFMKRQLYPGAKLIGQISKDMIEVNKSLLLGYPDRPATWLNIKYGKPAEKIDPEEIAGKVYLIIRIRSDAQLSHCELALGNAKYNPKLANSKDKKKKQISRDGWVGLPGSSKIIANLKFFRDPNATQILLPGGLNANGADKRAFILQLAPLVPMNMSRPCPWKYGCAHIRVDVMGDPVYLMGARCQYLDTPIAPPTPKPTPMTNRTAFGGAYRRPNGTRAPNSTRAPRTPNSTRVRTPNSTRVRSPNSTRVRRSTQPVPTSAATTTAPATPTATPAATNLATQPAATLSVARFRAKFQEQVARGLLPQEIVY